MGSVILMRAVSAGGSESALAQIDVPKNGAIVGVSWAGIVAFDTTADNQQWQLSFGSTISLVNDSRQSIDVVSAGQNTLATAVGSEMGVIDRYTQIPELPVSMGERLFLHSSASATTVGTIHCSIHFDFNMDQPMSRRR